MKKLVLASVLGSLVLTGCQTTSLENLSDLQYVPAGEWDGSYHVNTPKEWIVTPKSSQVRLGDISNCKNETLSNDMVNVDYDLYTNNRGFSYMNVKVTGLRRSIVDNETCKPSDSSVKAIALQPTITNYAPEKERLAKVAAEKKAKEDAEKAKRLAKYKANEWKRKQETMAASFAIADLCHEQGYLIKNKRGYKNGYMKIHKSDYKFDQKLFDKQYKKSLTTYGMILQNGAKRFDACTGMMNEAVIINLSK